MVGYDDNMDVAGHHEDDEHPVMEGREKNKKDMVCSSSFCVNFFNLSVEGVGNACFVLIRKRNVTKYHAF